MSTKRSTLPVIMATFPVRSGKELSSIIREVIVPIGDRVLLSMGVSDITYSKLQS